jgi:hypothetical protein
LQQEEKTEESLPFNVIEDDEYVSFWDTPEGQEEVKRIEEEIRSGQVSRAFNSAEEMIEDLKKKRSAK